MRIAMDKYKALVEESVIFFVMSIFSVLKALINQDGEIHWGKTFMKVFVNLISGIGFYSFLLAHKPWYGEYPQKVGVIMIVVYAGSKLIDMVVDAIYKFNLKEILRKWLF